MDKSRKVVEIIRGAKFLKTQMHQGPKKVFVKYFRHLYYINALFYVYVLTL